MVEIGIVNNRTIFFQQYSTESPWGNSLPTDNWLAFIVVSKQEKTKLFELTSKVIANNVCFVSCVGEQGELLHDILDEDLVFRQVDPEAYCPPFDIVTTWHDTVDDGLWYAIYTANNTPLIIDKILCLNAGNTLSENSFKQLIAKFESGYIPD